MKTVKSEMKRQVRVELRCVKSSDTTIINFSDSVIVTTAVPVLLNVATLSAVF
jgi:hypothetical protein